MARKANSVAARKAKGRRLAQLLCDLILDVIGKKGMTAEDVRPVPSGVRGPDVWLSSAATSYLPYAFECKNQERVNIWEWWKQCLANSDEKKKPVLVFKRNNQIVNKTSFNYNE